MSDNAPKVLLGSEQSDGQVAVVALGGGGRPPLHRHDFDALQIADYDCAEIAAGRRAVGMARV